MSKIVTSSSTYFCIGNQAFLTCVILYNVILYNVVLYNVMLLAAQDYGNKGQRGTICKALADIVSYIPESIKTVTERTIYSNGMQRLDNFETPRYSN